MKIKHVQVCIKKHDFKIYIKNSYKIFLFFIFPKNLINVVVLQYDYLHLHASMEHKKNFIIKAESFCEISFRKTDVL